MPSTYLPRPEAKLNTWLANFAEKIAEAPAAYGLTSGEAIEMSAASAAWQAAFTAARDPTTRTSVAIIAKNERRDAAVALARRLGSAIRANPAVTPGMRVGLGLHARLPEEPIHRGTAPQTYPMLVMTRLNLGSQTIFAQDSASPDRRAKPRGTIGMVLFRAVGPAPVRRPADAEFISLVTRTDFQSTFTHADHGKTATYFARWVNAKGEAGPWGPGTSVPIAA